MRSKHSSESLPVPDSSRYTSAAEQQGPTRPTYDKPGILEYAHQADRDRDSRLFPPLVVDEEVRSNGPGLRVSIVPVVDFEYFCLVYHGTMIAKHAFMLGEGCG